MANPRVEQSSENSIQEVASEKSNSGDSESSMNGSVGTDSLSRTEVFGLNFVNADSLDPVIESIIESATANEVTGADTKGYLNAVLTPNVDILVRLEKAPEGAAELNMFRRAKFCLPDGQPVVAASKLLDRELGARLTGSGLFELLWPKVVENSWPVLVIAPNDQVAAKLGAETPLAKFIVPAIFSVDDTATFLKLVHEIGSVIKTAKPVMIFSGLGHPKDALILNALISEQFLAANSTDPVFLGLGGSFDMYLGTKKRAPQWIQKVGLEWFYRFAQEPKRLFKRYFIDDVAFLSIVWKERRKNRGN